MSSNIVVVFVFKTLCPACDQFKTTKYAKVNNSRTLFEETKYQLEREGVRVLSFYIHDISMPSFLKAIRFFPSTYMMSADTYNNWESFSKSELYSRIVIMNSKFIEKPGSLVGYTTEKSGSTYSFMSPTDYLIFLADYQRTDMTTKFSTLPFVTPIVTQGISTQSFQPNSLSSNSHTKAIPPRRVRIKPLYL